MSKDWYLTKKPPVYTSGFENDDFQYYSVDGFAELLNSFLGSDIKQFNTKIWEHSQDIRVIVQNVTSDNQNIADVRQVLCPIGTLKCGQYLFFDKAYWLVATLPGNNGVYEKVIVWYCKSVLSIKSLLNGEVRQYPIPSDNATQYNSGEITKPQMTLGSSQHLVYMPYDDETIQFDNGNRFLLDKNKESPTAYKLTQVDSTTYSFGDIGLLQWTVCEDQFSKRLDNKEMMVANYYGNDSIYVIHVVNATSPLSLSIGAEFQFQTRVLKDGQPAEQTVISYESSDRSVATISETGKLTGVSEGDCLVSIACGDAVEKLLVSVENITPPEIYTISLVSQDGDFSIMYGDTEQFEVKVYKGDILQKGIVCEAEIMAGEELAEITSIASESVSIHTFDKEMNVGKTFMLHIWNADIGADMSATLKVGGLWDD